LSRDRLVASRANGCFIHNKGVHAMYQSHCVRVGLASVVLAASSSAAQFEVEKDDSSVHVLVDEKLFTTYHIKSGNKPILYPIIGPTGKPMTRSYPMKGASEGERADHPHHRSLWFTHGDVNGTSFWDEGARSGTIEHREFLRVEGGPQATIVTSNDWVDDDGEKICSDIRTLVFGADENQRWIDFDVTVMAGDKPVVFGDTKEGSFGIRVAGSMKVEAENGGHIVNNKGDVDKDTWGKQASWVDYHGPVDGELLGIAILNHPTSFRFPTYWHVRTYGLFAANVFGIHNFENNNEKDGSYILKPGKSFTLRYRVLLHKGDQEEGQVAQAFVEYAKAQKHDPVDPEAAGGVLLGN
jgi:hypothetical protein